MSLIFYSIQKLKQYADASTDTLTHTRKRLETSVVLESILLPVRKRFLSVRMNKIESFLAIAGKNFVFKIQSSFECVNIRTG